MANESYSQPARMAELAKSVKLLMVGAGGIGCELLKNLVLSGFRNIDVVDLDTIDVSNLNRQFLFHKKHVGMSKATVAVENVKRFSVCGGDNICSFQGNITSHDYDVNFFKGYTLVLNALDNRGDPKILWNHVNRLCLAADVPLIESGSAGYLGQVTAIKKGSTECYECNPKPAQRTYPGCTIRNTPSEPIHCIVWAKHLFNQLFGEADIDEDVSPDMADPEAAAGGGDDELPPSQNQNGVSAELPAKTSKTTENGAEQSADSVAAVQQRVSTRKWAIDKDYDSEALFTKLFYTDIEYLLTMANLWRKRRRPVSLTWHSTPDQIPSCSSSNGVRAHGQLMRDQEVWTPLQCRDTFAYVVEQLSSRLEDRGPSGDTLVWDKDDDVAVDFVTACANLRAAIFGIELKSRFQVKSMAGNIIPAIATTNAVVAGLIVLQAMKVLADDWSNCKEVYVTRWPNQKGKILVDTTLVKPNPKCYVCSQKPEVFVKLNVDVCTVKTLEERILKQKLSMVAPDVEIGDGKGTVLISSEPGETAALADKFLSAFSIKDGTILLCDDFMQKFELRLIVVNCSDMKADDEFEIANDIPSAEMDDVEPAAETMKLPSKRPVEIHSRHLAENEEPEHKRTKVTA